MSGTTYYDRPVLKEPVWIWAVPAYFYAGGAAGAASLIGATAHAADARGLAGLVRRCRWIGAGGTAVGTALLIRDLGRPERFLNMLRVFRPTSPLNVGSWLLATSSGAAGAAAVLPGRAANLAGYVSGALGAPLASYTAVVLSNSAIPAWAEARRSLPFLFAASGLSAAACLLELAELDPAEAAIVRRVGAVGKAAEIASMAALEREVSRVERVGRPYKEGVAGSLWKTAKSLSAAGLGLTLLPGRTRSKRFLAGLFGTAGALAIRFAVFYAGKASARDPHATFELQRTQVE